MSLQRAYSLLEIDREQLIERLLDTPAAREAAAQISAEKEAARERIRARIETLLAERMSAIAVAEPVHRAAKLAYAEHDARLKQAHLALNSAHNTLSSARSLHCAELRSLRAQLAQMDAP